MGMISAANRVVGRVQADGQLGADFGGFLGESFDAGNDAGGGDGHALRAEADFFDQQSHRGHEVVVVEERLAHAHEDQIHAIAAHADAVAVEDGDDLAGDFARGEVALQAKLRGQAELAVDRAADLAGDADGGPTRFHRMSSVPVAAAGWGSRLPTLFANAAERMGHAGVGRPIRAVASVAGFAVVALGHPDGFHRVGDPPAQAPASGLELGHLIRDLALDQIALCSVHRLEDLCDRPGGRPASLPGQSLAQSHRQGSDLV